MKFGLLSTALLAVVAVPAMAEGWTSYMPSMPSMPADAYVSAKGGYSILQDQQFDGAAPTVEMEDGYIGSVAAGGRYGNIRAEIEALYSRAEVDSVKGVAGSGDGNSELYAGMVNGYYDFKNSSFFTPYVGAGVGYGKVKFNDYSAGATQVIDGDDSVLAYQGIAGVAYEFNPCWSFTGEYRYIGTTDADVRTQAGQNTDANYQSHSILAGVKYSF